MKNIILLATLLFIGCSSNSMLLKRIEALEVEVKAMQEQQFVITDDGRESWMILPYSPQWIFPYQDPMLVPLLPEVWNWGESIDKRSIIKLIEKKKGEF